MSKNSNSKSYQMRERLAQLAARLITEQGIQDFAQAKRKAARQLGVPDTQHLPNNSEIEQALEIYQTLYKQDEQPSILQHLREKALAVMQLFRQFDPYLTGSVLSGTAGKYSDINLEIYTDNVKEIELFMVNNHIPYKYTPKRSDIGGQSCVIHKFSLNFDEETVNISIFSVRDMHNFSKNSTLKSKSLRIKADKLQELINEQAESKAI
jgi:predicted nucleotidyltransferase